MGDTDQVAGTDLTRAELRRRIADVGLRQRDLVHLERRDDRYSFHLVEPGGGPPGPGAEGDDPDAWMTYAGRWPGAGSEQWDAFSEDLLAELDSMTGGSDRCRWPLSDPWTSPDTTSPDTTSPDTTSPEEAVPAERLPPETGSGTGEGPSGG